MRYQRMIRTAEVLLLAAFVLCLSGCSVLLGGFSPGGREEFTFSCREELSGEEVFSETAAEPEPPAAEEEGAVPDAASGESLAASQPEASTGGVQADGKVDINTAGPEELMTLNGVGETRAKAIVEYRTQNGPFTKAEDIMLVPGIKEGVYSKIQDQIIVH